MRRGAGQGVAKVSRQLVDPVGHRELCLQKLHGACAQMRSVRDGAELLPFGIASNIASNIAVREGDPRVMADASRVRPADGGLGPAGCVPSPVSADHLRVEEVLMVVRRRTIADLLELPQRLQVKKLGRSRTRVPVEGTNVGRQVLLVAVGVSLRRVRDTGVGEGTANRQAPGTTTRQAHSLPELGRSVTPNLMPSKVGPSRRQGRHRSHGEGTATRQALGTTTR